jgi:TonB-linked SusC/RagA family outer membrane protein
LDPSILGKGTDWQSELFRNSAMLKHQLSISGGSEKSTYYLSGEYFNQDGIAIGSGFNRYSFRMNADTKPRTWIKMGVNANFDQTNEKLSTSSEGVISNALQQTPQVSVTNLDGSYAGGNNLNGANQYAPVNPIAIASQVTNTNLRREINGGGNIVVDILPGLIFKTTLSGSLNTANSIYFVPKMTIGWYVHDPATLSDDNSVSTYYNFNQLLEYTKQFGKHNFDLMVSHENQEGTWKNNGANINTFLTNDVIDVNAGDQTTATVSGGHNSWAMESYLGALNYNYDERYILKASVRADGSSNFGPNNRWGTFPAVSGAWRLSKEAWYNVSFMNEFKIRVETGLTGNNGSGGIYSPMSAAPSAWGTGFLPGQYANPDLKWESTNTDNIGFNASFFNNRIQLEGDYYHKITDNLIMQAYEPGYMGTQGNGGPGAPQVNAGSLQNNGWGITLITTNINTKNFKWESNFNIAGFRSKILKLNTNTAALTRDDYWTQMGGTDWTQSAAIGQSPWLMMGYKTDGIFTSVDEINKSALPVDVNGKKLPVDVNDVWVGDVKYKDVSGPNGKPDGIIDYHDLTPIGNPYPKSFGGFTNSFTYKDFELSVLLTYSYGNDIYNYMAQINSNPSEINLSRNLLANAENYSKISTDANGNPYITNPGAVLPRISYGPNGNWNRFTDQWIEDGSYIKLKNVSLSYNLPNSLMTKQKVVRNVRLTFSAQNLFTLTKYTGYDPEVGAYVGSNASAGSQPIGLDKGKYPLTAIYTFNIMVNF